MACGSCGKRAKIVYSSPFATVKGTSRGVIKAVKGGISSPPPNPVSGVSGPPKQVSEGAPDDSNLRPSKKDTRAISG